MACEPLSSPTWGADPFALSTRMIDGSSFRERVQSKSALDSMVIDLIWAVSDRMS